MFQHTDARCHGRSASREPLTANSRLALLFLLLTASASLGGATPMQQRQPDVNGASNVALSPDSRLVAVFGVGDTWFSVLSCADGEVVLNVGQELLSRFIRPPAVQSVTWSADGRFVAVELYDGDVDHLILIAEPLAGIATLSTVNTPAGKAGIAAWGPSGHVLYAAPALWQGKGLYRIDPVTRRAEAILTTEYVDSNISVVGRCLVVRVCSQPYSSYSIISVDTGNKRVRQLMPTRAGGK